MTVQYRTASVRIRTLKAGLYLQVNIYFLIFIHLGVGTGFVII